MGYRLFIVFVLVPLLEMMLLIRLGEVIGFWNTVLLILVTGLLGSALARREGFAVWRRFSEKTQTGQMRGTELIDGLIILVSGALLITPGVLTDVAGLLGLIPPSRALIRRALKKRFERGLEQGRVSGSIRFGIFGFDNGSAGQPGGDRRPFEPHAGNPRDISHIVDEYGREKEFENE